MPVMQAAGPFRDSHGNCIPCSSSDGRIQGPYRLPRRQRQLPGNVRLHGLRLLRRGDREDVLSERQRIRVADAVAFRVRRGLPDATVGRDRARRVHRPSRPAQRPDPDARADGARHADGRGDSGLRDDRRARARARAGRASVAGLLGGRRTGRRVGVSVGDRDQGQQGLLLFVAVGQPAGGCGVRRADRRVPEPPAARRPDDGMGLARAVPDRLSDRAVPVPDPPLAERDGRVPREEASSDGQRNFCVDAPELGRCARRYGYGHHDDGVVLHDHRVHADLRQGSAETLVDRYADRYRLHWRIESDLAACVGRDFGSRRPPSRAADVHDSHDPHVVSGRAVARRRSVVRAPADGRVVAVVPVRLLQRRHGRRADGSDARRRAHSRLFAGVQPGDDDRRLHAGHRDVPDPHDGQQGRARPVDERCRRVRFDRDARAVSHAGSAQSVPDGLSGACSEAAKQKPPHACGGFSFQRVLNQRSIAQRRRHFLDDFRPLAGLRLPHEPRGRIPRAALIAREPAPVGGERQHQPERLAKRARQVRNRRIDRHHAVQTLDDRRRIRKIANAPVEAMNVLRTRMRVERGAFIVGKLGLQHDPVDAVEREQRLERGKRQRAVFLALRASRPRDSELALRVSAERAAPRAARRGRRSEIRRACRNRVELRAERERQAQQRTLQIGAGTRRALRDQRDAPLFGRRREQRHELRLHFEDDAHRKLRDDFDEAYELQRVAETLLGVHEQRASFDRLAVPARQRRRARRRDGVLQPPFVLGQSALEVAEREQRHAAIHMRHRQIGPQTQRLIERTHGGGVRAERVMRGAEAQPCEREVRIETDGALEAWPGLLVTAKRRERVAEAEQRGRQVRLHRENRFELGDGLFVLTRRVERVGEIEARGREARLDLERGAEMGAGLRRGAERVERHADVVVRACVARPQFERAAERIDGFAMPPERMQRIAEIDVRRRVHRLQTQRLLECIDGVFVAPGERVRIAEVVVRHRKRRRERQRIAKAFDCLVEPAERLQRVAEIQLQPGVLRAQVGGAADEVGRFFVLALLMAQHAEQMQRVDVSGIEIEGSAIAALGVVEPAVTMRAIRAVENWVHDAGEGVMRENAHFPTLGGCFPT
ncbi:hypothetical protein PSAB6_540006 [Paraburkholderia sabiae]|nr:hypothetical protein PSAB6_540006 [Paraburkholderia sabiae]